jgi:hypothetical protein
MELKGRGRREMAEDDNGRMIDRRGSEVCTYTNQSRGDEMKLNILVTGEGI